LRQVVAALSLRAFDRLLGVGIRLFDVTEGDELLQKGTRSGRILVAIWWMHSALAFDHFPTRDCRVLDRAGESFEERFSIRLELSLQAGADIPSGNLRDVE